MGHIEKSESEVIVVTGYSGSGKNTVLRALEDLDFFCVDNLPLDLLPAFFDLIHQPKMCEQKVALGIDVRGAHNMNELLAHIKALDEYRTGSVKICFLTSSSRVLLKRYQETRRKHPLGDHLDIADAIKKEMKLLKPLASVADLVLDTGQLNIHQLRSFIRHSFSGGRHPIMLVNFISFGFKYGVPSECNFIYDLRSLPNPYFVDELRDLGGMDEAVIKYFFGHKEVKEFWKKFIDFVSYTLQRSYEEGRYVVNIGIGCTGGRHRSVAFVCKLANEKIENVHVLIKHRDLNKDLDLRRGSKYEPFVGMDKKEKGKEDEV